MEFVLLFGLLLLSAFFSGSEAALFGLGKVAVNRMRQSDDRAERLAAHLLEAPRDLLVTVLFGNGLVNIAFSVCCAFVAARHFAGASLATQAALAVVVVSPLLLFGGEVTPKTVAAQMGEALARAVAVPLTLWRGFIRPVRALLERLSDGVVRRFGGPRPETAGGLGEDEFLTLVEMGAEAGIVDQQERALIRNVLDFDDLLVRDVMVPAERMFSLSEATPVADAMRAVIEHKYSRIPLWRGRPDRIVGVLYAKDLLAQRWGAGKPRTLRQLMRRPFFVLPKMRADNLLETFRHRRIHMAVVVDEFGGAHGVVTMEDLLEELFGPITDVGTERKGEDASP